MPGDVELNDSTATAAHPHRGHVRKSPSVRSEPGTVQSVDRAQGLIEALARSGSGTSLTELSSQLGLNISTCHHLLATLAKWGYVAQNPGRKTYALGARVLHLSQSFMRQVDLPGRAQHVLDEISRATGETAHLSVLQGDNVVTVARCEARHAVKADIGAIGAIEPAHAAATGKAMLAWLPEENMRRILDSSEMTALTPRTVTDVDALVEEFRHVRRNGFALDCEECQPGVTSAGAAVRDSDGAVIGAMAVTAPSYRATEAHIAIMREAVTAGARKLSQELGAPGSGPAPEPSPRMPP